MKLLEISWLLRVAVISTMSFFELYIFYFHVLKGFLTVFLLCLYEWVMGFDFWSVLATEFFRFIKVKYAPFVSYNFPEFVVT